MIPDSRQGPHTIEAPALPGLLRGAAPELISAFTQIGTPELFRRGTSVPLLSIGTNTLVIAGGRLAVARVLLNGPGIPLGDVVAGDIFCLRALHPIVRANAVFQAEEETMAYSLAPEDLVSLRAHRPDLSAVLDRQVNILLQRLLAETETLLQSFQQL